MTRACWRCASAPCRRTALPGPASAGKSYTVQTCTRLLRPEAYHVIDASSPRVMIYDDAELRHRVVIFGEADSLRR